ncbi:unnamed protein product [Ambrosiozyma monospora]|uniref:Unnamed protein product n=1 Tax=Ambrosiozyma monospora TaxID=43982 RepID=A0ACB5SX28_AMBMO|nr:unnamed protein product [Ambrosiozyma monospora]
MKRIFPQIVTVLCLAAAFLFVLLTGSSYSKQPVSITNNVTSTVHKSDFIPFPNNSFHIKHIFHNSPVHKVHKRLDITPEFHQKLMMQSSSESVNAEDLDLFADESPFSHSFKLKSVKSETIRMANRDPDFVESYLNYALEVGQQEISKVNLDWQRDQISIPDIKDPETILSLGIMSSNAYANFPEDSDWEDVGLNYNLSDSYGWLNSGVRGHVFATDDNSTVVIAIKGTSAAGLASGGNQDTVENDKTNDNLLFSCCCARVTSLWSTVCDCYEKSYTCNQNCLEREMRRQDRYYKATLDLYRNVTHLYPFADIWVTGHSLGGALSSLLGRTFGLPAVTFEAPGELLATKRLHLPMPPGLPAELEHIWHFGNNADPIFMGVCNGASSTCSIAGYAMETQCHSGQKCIYDTVADLGWHVNMLNHRLRTVIDDVLKTYNETANCSKPPPCLDCYNWLFVDHSRDNWKSTTTFLTPTETPTGGNDDKKCLKRTWYGRCYKWEGDDDDDDDDDSENNTTKSSSATTSSTAITETPVTTSKVHEQTDSQTSTSTTSLTATSTSSKIPPECIRWSWLGYCLEYGPAKPSINTAVPSV